MIVVMERLEGLAAPENCSVPEKHKCTCKQEEPVCVDPVVTQGNFPFHGFVKLCCAVERFFPWLVFPE